MQTLFQNIDRRIADECARLQIPGLIVCLRNDEGILLHKAYGVHDLETGEPLNPDALFPIASQSKSFTALAILKLVEAQRLTLDDLLILHLPHLNHPRLAAVTIRDVLRHETPLGRGPETDQHYWSDAPLYPTADELRKPDLPGLIKDNPEDTSFNYSNFGYALLGLVVADKAGLSYEDYIISQILKPNKWDQQITPKRSREQLDQISGIPVGYWAGFDGKRHPANLMYLDGFASAGGFGGRIQAVSDFFHKLLTGQLLAPESMRELLAFKNYEPGSGYGLGLRRRYTDKGEPIIGHPGGLPGYDSATFFHERLGVTISLMRTQLSEPIDPNERYLLHGLINRICNDIDEAQPRPGHEPMRPFSATLRETEAPSGNGASGLKTVHAPR